MKEPTNLTQQIKVKVEDDRTGMSVETLKRAFADNLYYIQGKNQFLATPYDYYMALAYTVRDRLLQRWIKTLETYTRKNTKTVYYLSAEFLMGRQLTNNLLNLGIYDRL
ncbi:MAG: glycogen/starch/alpha-glucan phosphorylase, partial [Moorea sp. SIO4G2]|nr:glycogen/starch/alpha-glucan phosphorylase [Moorena sp. SIO4G2]